MSNAVAVAVAVTGGAVARVAGAAGIGVAVVKCSAVVAVACLGIFGCSVGGVAGDDEAGANAGPIATYSIPSSAPSQSETAALPMPIAVVEAIPEDVGADVTDVTEVTELNGAGGKSSELCPANMMLVTGKYCPDVRHNCLQWMDPPGPYENFRCAKYGAPTCASEKKTTMRFCIDRDEYTPPGEALPVVHHSWTSAKATCEAQGKRMCMESEWQFACEGEQMRPYPYGFERDATACNIDRRSLGKPNVGLRDLRTPAGSHPRCISPFGVRDMSGNVEEWATQDHPFDPYDKATMKGAWWLPGRNTCRAATTGHGENYEGPQVGVRCCSAAKSS